MRRREAKTEQLRQEIAQQLRYQISKINPEISIKHSYNSEWSLTFDNKGKPIADFLKSVFGIDTENWHKKYIEATSGPGNEGTRILTLHSSALLALLTFVNVSPDNPIVIQGEKYVDCWFEVRNIVIPGRNPSSIDVLLRAESGNLLFLESKFTEYLDASYPNIVVAYKPFYERLLPLLPKMPLQIVFPKRFKEDKMEVVGFGLKPTSNRKELNCLYLSGIKQCISHLMGIANGPAEGELSEWGKNAHGKKLRFGTILYKLKLTQFRAYEIFYKKTIGKITSEMISASMAEQAGVYSNQIEVLSEIITYQDVMRSSDFRLPVNVKQFYRL